MISLRRDNIFDRVLLSPFRSGIATELVIIAGYASPRMLAEHLATILQFDSKNRFNIQLIIGMGGARNLSVAAVSAFVGLILDNPRFSSKVWVPDGQLDIHSKAYLWLRDGDPVEAWVGSANYSRLAFGLSSESDDRDELLIQADPKTTHDYIQAVLKQSTILSDGIRRVGSDAQGEIEVLEPTSGFVLPHRLSPECYAVCPLVNSRTNEVHNAGAGLNWGQPTESRRRSDSAAAYIPVPSRFRNFFPPTGETFEVFCPDGQVLILARSQQGGKALSTPASNELLGQYFRGLLGVENGRPILTKDLNDFGSDCVVFEKGVSGTFSLHFYPGLQMEEIAARFD